MFAVIKSGSKQYKVEKGSVIKIDKTDKKEGSKIVFDKVLLVSDGDSLKVGNPFIKGKKVEGKIKAHIRGQKIRTVKHKKRKRYRRTIGFKALICQVEITNI